MMPIIWRYLLVNYLKVLSFCTFAFIALLLTLRLEEIAHFATLGPQGIYILYFTFYQIPYILPIALPVSSLISSILLVKHLCKNHEMTALRAAGLPISSILAPLLLASLFLSCINFYVVSELATNSHLASSLIKNELRSINPLLLLSNKHLMKLKGIYFDTLGASRLGESASNSIIAMPDQQNKRINLILAKNLQASPEAFTGQFLTLFSTLAPYEDYDQILIENMAKNDTAIKDFTKIVQRKVWTLHNDHLKMSLLLCRLHESLIYFNQQVQNDNAEEAKQIKRDITRIYSEIVRRFSVAMAVFTFTLLGASCGFSISRRSSIKGVLWVLILATTYLIAYFSAKGIDHLFTSSSLFYLIPHLLMIAVSCWMLRKATRGIES